MPLVLHCNGNCTHLTEIVASSNQNPETDTFACDCNRDELIVNV